jgi:hypothetical protein
MFSSVSNSSFSPNYSGLLRHHLFWFFNTVYNSDLDVKRAICRFRSTTSVGPDETPPLSATHVPIQNYFLKLWIISTTGRTRWTGDQTDARLLPTHDSTTQKDKDKYSCRKRDSNPRSQRPSDQGPRLRPRDLWDRKNTPNCTIKRLFWDIYSSSKSHL